MRPMMRQRHEPAWLIFFAQPEIKKTLAMAATPRYAMMAAGAEDRATERAIDEGCHSIARGCNVQVLCLEYSTGQ